MRPTVYLETTIVSYLVGWLNRNDLQVAAHQEITRRWWQMRRHEFELFASAVVIDEAGDGDPALASQRLSYLSDVALLRVSDKAHALKALLLKKTQIPHLTNCSEETMPTNFRDPIVEEVHRTREKLLEKHGGPAGYADHLRQLESELGERVVAREPKPPVKTRRRAS